MIRIRDHGRGNDATQRRCTDQQEDRKACFVVITGINPKTGNIVVILRVVILLIFVEKRWEKKRKREKKKVGKKIGPNGRRHRNLQVEKRFLPNFQPERS